jgi:uncharacterized surface protein with fasciclin (FAS1) repeats
VDFMGDALDHTKHFFDDVRSKTHRLHEAAASLGGDVADDLLDAEVLGHGHGHPHDFSKYTIYQIISHSNYTKKFAKAVDEFPDVVQLLNSTDKHNYTLFVPIDAAFEDIPDHGDHKPDKDFIKSVLLYHVGIGSYPARRIVGTHTIPSALDEKLLGDEPQRLRTGVGLTGVTVNFYSRVVAADFTAKNGVIHAVRSILVPPPVVGRELSLFPSKFSTLLLAFDKTDFVKYIHGIKMTGSTVFAPSNAAFAALGPRTNAFLFNTEKGIKYLRALLKYHIVADFTLYSDAYYQKKKHDDHDDKDAGSEGFTGREHFDLPTLLGDDAYVNVDILTYGLLTTFRINSFSRVTVNDGVAKNGVIQVISRVLIPPHKHHKHDSEEASSDDISLEELIERLDPYLDAAEDEPADFMGDL